MITTMPGWFWWLVLGSNTLALLGFAWDKLMARLGRRRVRESSLLWLTFLGCIGAWCAMSLFRHKTRKGSFRWRAFWCTLMNPLWLALWWQVR
jgi:uncharacterized membrane protein YsdA (DUF1294 family)